MSTDANKLEHIQQKIVALCFNRFFPEVCYCYSLALEGLKFPSLLMRRYRLKTFLLIQVYLNSKFCPPFLEIVGLRVPARYISDFALFSVCSLLDMHLLNQITYFVIIIITVIIITCIYA
jgi:hypothetical protein